MKSFKLLSLLAFFSVIMSSAISPESQSCADIDYTVLDGSGIVWKSEEIDLGKIPQGKPVNIEFEFTNKSKEVVIISNVATSCGCTIADYSKTPIAVNASSKITATYNAAAAGAFTKAITVTFANNEVKVLNIKGVVI